GQHVPVRVVDRISGEGIPISPQGTLLVSFAHGQTIRALFGNGTPSGALSLQPEQPIFLTKLVYPPSTQNPDFAPESASQFENGARILGADLVESSPEAIALKLHWTPTRNKPAASYHFSVRVVTQDGKTIGQHDVPSLSRELWRAGDVVISPLRIPLSEPVSDLAAVRVQVIMYAYPSIQNVNVVDEGGNALGQWLFLRHNSCQASR
ncbi:MAG: hypothetical protein NZ571_16185, partial [Anaerolineae bacterium]|nr:hypothetical protein [Anaerolineae bacterium]